MEFHKGEEGKPKNRTFAFCQVNLAKILNNNTGIIAQLAVSASRKPWKENKRTGKNLIFFLLVERVGHIELRMLIFASGHGSTRPVCARPPCARASVPVRLSEQQETMSVATQTTINKQTKKVQKANC